MRTKITTCIVIALMLLSGVSQAQQRKRAERMQRTMIKLTDTQKEELKAAKIEFAKATLDVRNELNELKAHQRTLMSAEKLDENKINENIDQMSSLKKQLMEERINMRLATSGLCRAEQCKLGNKRGNRSGMRPQGMKHRKGNMTKGNRMCQSVNKMNRRGNILDLSDKQQEQMKSLKLEHQKSTQNLREEMQELRLKQKHLLNDEIPNKNVISSNLDQISKIQNQLAKARVANQKEIRNILDKDQLVLFLSKPHKMNKNRRGRMHRNI